MRSKSILSAVLIAQLALAPAAFAQGGNDPMDRTQNYNGGEKKAERQADRQQRQGPWSGMAKDGGYVRGNGERYYDAHQWRRGDRLPPEYRHRQYVVDDWRGHHLSAPPRGYQWVQVGGDYVLIAIATGVIANLILNGH